MTRVSDLSCLLTVMRVYRFSFAVAGTENLKTDQILSKFVLFLKKLSLLVTRPNLTFSLQEVEAEVLLARAEDFEIVGRSMFLSGTRNDGCI